MGENSGLCGILETIKNNFHIRSLDLSLHSTQGTKDTVIEEYLSRLDERLLNIDISSKRFNNLTKEVHNAIYDLGDDPTITIKCVYHGSTVVVWGREDYWKEAPKQLEDRDVYGEVQMTLAFLSTPL